MSIKQVQLKFQNKRKISIVFCFALQSLGGLFAQQNTITLGGNATGTGGSASYSIGQLDYESETSQEIYIIEGLQQPYEICVVSGDEEIDINLTFSVYPNPASDFVILSVQNADKQNMTFWLYDAEGRLIEKQKINSNETRISMEDLANGIYFIKVLDERSELKTFKIIKNK